MQTVSLGQSSLTVSRLAYGCRRLAGALDSGKVTPDAEANGRKAVAAAYEFGYSLFDLADVYSDGHCESIFGSVLKEISGMRERVVIANKCGVLKKTDPHPDSPYRYDLSTGHILRSCDRTLKRLGTDAIDLLLIHRPDYLAAPVEIAEAFGKLKKTGKVREFGVSHYRPSQLVALQRACPMPLVVSQVEISLAKIDCLEDGTLDQCLAERITPMAWSPLSAGRLAENTPIDMQAPDHAHRIHVREVLELVARERGVTRSVVALAWLLKHPSGIVPIVSSTQIERVRDAINATEIELTRDEWYRLMEAAYGQRLP